MPIQPYILTWLAERKIKVPDDDIYKHLKEGRIFLQMLHAHIEHSPEFPKGRLDRWKMIASILLDAGVEITDYGLRMVLHQDKPTLEEILHTIYALFHNPEGVTLPVSCEPEPEMSYPLMYGVIVDRATSTQDFKDRLQKLIKLEHPDADKDETNLLVLEEMSQRLNQVKKFDLKEDFLFLVFEQLKKVESEQALRASVILTAFVEVVGNDAVYQLIVAKPSPRMHLTQRELVKMIRDPLTPPELLDFLHHFVLDLATPDHLTTIVQDLFVPQLTLRQAIEECSKLLEVAGGGKEVIQNFSPWLLTLAGNIIQGGDGSEIAKFKSENEPLYEEIGLAGENSTIIAEDDDGSGDDLVLSGYADNESGAIQEKKEPEKKEKKKDDSDSDEELTPEEAAEKALKYAEEKKEQLRKEKEAAELKREAVILSLRLWTDFPDQFESLGEKERMKYYLSTEIGLTLMGQQAVLSELAAVVFVCPDIYDMMLDALRRMFSKTHQRRILLRTLLDLHLGNPHISFGPLLDLVASKLLRVQCGVAEGEALIMFAQHPGLNQEFSELTSTLVGLSKDLVAHEPFLHTHACAVLLMLGQSLGDDGDFINAIQYFTKALLTESEPAKHPALLFHCIIKLHHNSCPNVQQGMVDAAHLFVQILVRSLEREEKDREIDMAERARVAEIKRQEEEAKRLAEEKELAEAEIHGLKQKVGEAEDPLAEAERAALARQERDRLKKQDAADKIIQKRFDWADEVKMCVAELGVGFEKVPVAELDPPPTPRADTPLTESVIEKESTVHDDNIDDDENLLTRSEVSVSEGLNVTSSVIDVKEKQKHMLEKLAERKIYEYIKKTYVDPLAVAACEKGAKRQFAKKMKTGGFINPNARTITVAKRRHEERLRLEALSAEQRRAEEAEIRDAKRLERHKILKSMMSAKAKQEENEKTPHHPGFFQRVIKEVHASQAEWRKTLMQEETKIFVEIYRMARDGKRKAQQEEAQHVKLEEMRARQQEASRRELLRSKLDEYFDVKQQQEEAQRREDWEGKMQGEFEARLLMAKKSDRQKREVALWKMEKERLRREEELEEQREQQLHDEDQYDNGSPGPARATSAQNLYQNRNSENDRISASAQGRHRLPPLGAGSSPGGKSLQSDASVISKASTNKKFSHVRSKINNKPSSKQTTPSQQPTTPGSSNSKQQTPLGSKQQTPQQEALPGGSNNSKQPAKRKQIWVELKAKLPTARNAEAKAARKKLFSKFDPNGNGFLSLAEVDAGCRKELSLEQLTDDLAPILMRAFTAAKDSRKAKGKNKKHGDDYVEKAEFRLLFVYIKRYFELWFMFDEIDTSDDRRVNMKEFKSCVPEIEGWGVKIDDPEASFKEIDTNGGGIILFNEFSEWAIAKGLDLEEEESDEDDELPAGRDAGGGGGSGGWHETQQQGAYEEEEEEGFEKNQEQGEDDDQAQDEVDGNLEEEVPSEESKPSSEEERRRVKAQKRQQDDYTPGTATNVIQETSRQQLAKDDVERRRRNSKVTEQEKHQIKMDKRQQEEYTPNTATTVVQEASRQQMARNEVEERRRSRSSSPPRRGDEVSEDETPLMGPDGEEL